MRRIVVTEFISLDGVVEDPGGAEGFRHGGWSFKFNDPDGMKYKLDETMDHEAMLLGRVTYEGFAQAWPGRTDDVGFADKMNSMPKYVVSQDAHRRPTGTTRPSSAATSPRRSPRSRSRTAGTSSSPAASAWCAG